MELSGRTVVVTGAGGGLGEVVARRCAARGAAAVVAVDVDPVAAQRVADDLAGHGGRGRAVTADLAHLDSVEQVARAVEGEVALLVNNAGGWAGAGRAYPEATTDEWRRVLDLNLVVPMALTQRLLPQLAGGAVVHVSSSAGRDTEAYACPEYAVAKAGLVRLTTASTGLAASHGVRVGCVVPGWIGLDRAHRERAALPPEQRPALVPPETVAEAVLDLATDDGSAGRVVVLAEGRPPEVVDR